MRAHEHPTPAVFDRFRAPTIDYSQAFARAEGAARQTLAWLAERKERGAALVAQLEELPSEAAQEAKIREFGRLAWEIEEALAPKLNDEGGGAAA
jgi:hypothetical protein